MKSLKTITQNKRVCNTHQSNPFNDSLIQVYREAVEETQNLRKVAQDNGLTITLKGVKQIV